MKAIVYTEYGSADVLRVQEVAPPAPRGGELLIRTRAAEVTKSDCEMRSFHFPVKWFWLPLRMAVGLRRPRRPILGIYFSGIIEAVGDSVRDFKVGDAVFGSTGLRMGAYGEYLTVPATATLVDKPSNLSFEEAAAVPLGGLNALHFMRRARIRPGDRVLVNGAGGSIGIFAVQLAKHMGAEVTAVDNAAKQGLLRRIGADHTVDYAEEDFTQSGRTYDVIFDMVVSSSYGRCLRSIKPGGRYLIGNPRVSDMLRSTLSTRFANKEVVFAFAQERRDELRDLKALLEQGVLQVPIDQVFSPERAADAHRRVQTEQRIGAVVIAHGSS